jgi:hypothetical protein
VSTATGNQRLRHLKNLVRRHASRASPGAIAILNLLCMKNAGTDAITLFFTSPSKLYQIILEFRNKDVFAADILFTSLFIKPIAEYLENDDRTEEKLLHLVKSGKNKEFFDYIAKHKKLQQLV